MWDTYLLCNPKWVITIYGISTSLLLFYFFHAGCSYEFQIQNIHWGEPIPYRMYSHMTPQTHQFFIVEGRFIYNVQTVRSWFFSIFWIQLLWFLPHAILDGLIILSLGVILHLIRDISIAVYPIYEALPPFLSCPESLTYRRYMLPM